MSKTVKNVNQIRMKLIVAHSNSEKEETQTFWGYNKKKNKKRPTKSSMRCYVLWQPLLNKARAKISFI